MTVQNQKMMQYLRLSDEIDQLEKGLPNQEAELKNRVCIWLLSPPSKAMALASICITANKNISLPLN